MNQEIEGKQNPLNYVPLSEKREQSNWKQKVWRCFSDISEELQSFWSFFWRWLLLYTPFWLFFMWVYCEFSSAS